MERMGRQPLNAGIPVNATSRKTGWYYVALP